MPGDSVMILVIVGRTVTERQDVRVYDELLASPELAALEAVAAIEAFEVARDAGKVCIDEEISTPLDTIMTLEFKGNGKGAGVDNVAWVKLLELPSVRVAVDIKEFHAVRDNWEL